MANHMTAREAWEIVLEGNPAHYCDYEWDRCGPGSYAENKAIALADYARACAIVEALVHAHEDMGELSDDDVTGAVAHVRALERGEGGGK